MDPRDTAAFVLLALVLAVTAPTLAAATACPESADAECCGLDGAACACCAQGPRLAVAQTLAWPGDGAGQAIGLENALLPPEAFPRDILHVPRHLPPR